MHQLDVKFLRKSCYTWKSDRDFWLKSCSQTGTGKHDTVKRSECKISPMNLCPLNRYKNTLTNIVKALMVNLIARSIQSQILNGLNVVSVNNYFVTNWLRRFEFFFLIFKYFWKKKAARLLNFRATTYIIASASEWFPIFPFFFCVLFLYTFLCHL